MKVESSLRRPSLYLAIVGPIFFMEISGALTPDDIGAMRDFHLRMTQHERSAVVTLVHRIALPDAATRARASSIMQHIKPGTTRVVALLSGGLWASAARSVLTGLYMMSGRKHVHTVVTSVDGALDLVASGLGVSRGVVDGCYAGFVASKSEAAAVSP